MSHVHYYTRAVKFLIMKCCEMWFTFQITDPLSVVGGFRNNQIYKTFFSVTIHHNLSLETKETGTFWKLKKRKSKDWPLWAVSTLCVCCSVEFLVSLSEHPSASLWMVFLSPHSFALSFFYHGREVMSGFGTGSQQGPGELCLEVTGWRGVKEASVKREISLFAKQTPLLFLYGK